MSKYFLAALAALTISSCATRSGQETAGTQIAAPPTDVAPSPAPTESEPPAPSSITESQTPSAPLTDQARADALWRKMAGFKSWPAPGGLDGLRPGESIHGDYIRLFGNSTANANLTSLPAGSIIVKEGYRDEEGTLMKAITAMEKVPGYNDEAGDWFFARYNDSGKATRINRGCASCHEDADGDDFSFIND